MKKPIKLVWNAYNYRSVGQGLRVFNIFDHYSFMVITDTQPHIDRKELNRLITDCYLKRTVAEPPLLFSHVNLSDAEKIDVYEQVRLNWDEFVDYVWSFSKSATKR